MTAQKIDPRLLAFDVDGVVADTMALFLDIAQKDYDIRHIRYDDITEYMLSDCLDLDIAVIGEIIEKLLCGRYDHGLAPLPGAPQVLGRMAAEHGPLRFITARPCGDTIRTWLNRVLPVRDADIDVAATGAFDAKIQVLKDKGVSWFVEDRLDTCFLLQDAGIKPVLFKQPWNRKPHPFVEVESWKELENLMER